MIDARHEHRIVSSERCELDLDGSVHQCRLDNISSSGAQVNCLGFLRETWPGDRGVLRLTGQGCHRTCHVTHIAASKIGVRFDD